MYAEVQKKQVVNNRGRGAAGPGRGRGGPPTRSPPPPPSAQAPITNQWSAPAQTRYVITSATLWYDRT